jgi:hypothetical protein
MTKADELCEMLRAGWQSTQDIHLRFSWGNNSIRGAISTIAKKRNLTIERQRIEGITSYRISA